MAIRKIDQSYTLINIIVEEFDDALITSLMRKYSTLASARIGKTKFNDDATNSLKFYVHHAMHDNYAVVINDIESLFKNNKISKKVYK